MKIQGKAKVEKVYEAKIAQPYPVFKEPVTVNNKPADLAFRTGQVQYVIDGVTYNGWNLVALIKKGNT